MTGRDRRLTALFVKNVSEPGVYGDGGHGSHGLRLVVQAASGGGVRKSWVQRIRINGKATNLGLGQACAVPLAHTVRNSTEWACARSDMLDLRRELMADWAKYISG